MLSPARNLFTDSLLLASILYRSDDARIKKHTLRLLPGFSDPKFFKNDSQRAELGESVLEKVQADKGRKKQPIGALKDS